VGTNILAGRNAEHKQQHSVEGYDSPALRLKKTAAEKIDPLDEPFPSVVSSPPELK